MERPTCQPRTLGAILVLTHLLTAQLTFLVGQSYQFNCVTSRLPGQVTSSRASKFSSIESVSSTAHGQYLPNFSWDNRTCALAWEKTNLLPPDECGYPPYEGEVWNMLITGTGRAGTTMVAKTLTDLGIPVPHDGLEPTIDGGIASWALAPNVQKYPEFFCPFCDEPKVGRFRHVFHQVRDPLDCIPSLVTEVFYWRSQPWLNLHVPEVDFTKYTTRATYDDKLLVALQFWVHWNSILNYTFIPRHAVERIDIPHILGLAGYPPERIPNASACEKVLSRNKGHNARKHQGGITWKHLMALNASLARRAMEMAREYGYSYSDEQYGKKQIKLSKKSIKVMADRKSVKLTGPVKLTGAGGII